VQARDIGGDVTFVYGPGSPLIAPRQLPGGVRFFIDRAPDLAKLDELLSEPGPSEEPVVAYVISGTAGVGKTSLAVHWANRVRDHFPDGQLYVDLRGYDPGPPVTADEALEQFLLALGVPATVIPRDLGAKSSMYRSALAGKKMLIILDNAERILQVRPLIPGEGRSLAIVTSRSQLTGLQITDGAQRSTLEILSEEDSLRLLTEITSPYRRGDSRAELVELAALCARLPLALRIAAQRAASRPSMPLGDLLADLRDESELWNALSTDDDPEANSVRTVFAWSYHALSPAAARLFCFLGLHPGGEFSEAAAVALADEEPRAVRSSLAALVGASLLAEEGYQRYKFHDLLRIYAIDQAQHEVSQGEQLAAVTRVCEWYLRSAFNCAVKIAHETTYLFDLPPSGITAVSFDDHSAAMAWYLSEKTNLVGAARAAFGTRNFLLAWQFGALLERIYTTFNHFQDWRTTSELGLAAALELGQRQNEAAMQESLGRLARMLMRLDEAAIHYDAAIVVHREFNDQPSLVKDLNGVAWVHLFAHRLDAALQALSEALPVARELGDDFRIAVILFGLGYTHLQLLLPDEAEGFLDESSRIFQRLGDRLNETMVTSFLSYLARSRGDTARALVIAQEAVGVSADLGNKLFEATALIYLGKAQLAARLPGEALESFQGSARRSRQEGDLSREGWAIDGAGLAYQMLGQLDEAIDFHLRSVAICRQLGDRWKLARSLERLADALSDDPDEARRARLEAIEILADFPDPKSRAIRDRLLARTGQAS
jgi:tetratricopeptide (TPR) repeat protein